MSRPASGDAPARNEGAERGSLAALVLKALEVGEDELLDAAATIINDVLDVECTAVLELSGDESSLVLRAGAGWDGKAAGSAIGSVAPDTQWGATLQSRVPVTVSNLITDTRFSGSGFLPASGIVSGISVTIDGHRGPYGVLAAHSRERRHFTRSNVKFLRAVAAVLSMAIGGGRANEDAQLYADIFKRANTGLAVWQANDLADPDNVSLVLTNPAMSDYLPALAETNIGRACAEVARSGEARDLGEIRFRGEDDTERTFVAKAFPLPESCVGVTFEDVTARIQAEESVRHLAFHDGLTGLPNRSLFIDRLTQALARGRRSRELIGVAFLDCDRLKLVNDTLGHNMGDSALRGVAERLVKLLRDGDSVARMGGDEFALLFPGLRQIEDIVEIGERVLNSFRELATVDGAELLTSISMGVAVWPTDGDDAETLLKNADAAVYRAKEEGGDCYQLYTPSMNARARERVALQADLRGALDRGEFVTHYQPQVDIESGQIAGSEALVRWQHPEHGLVPPADFIPLAEETGVILALGEWVLEEACARASSWQTSAEAPVEMAVNLSARQFRQRDLVEVVARVLSKTRLEPQRLQLEITETAAMRDADLTLRILKGLKEMGVRIAIDDFGTGYSSLAYLKRFPLDVLKIDRSLVSDIVSDQTTAAITGAVAEMSRGLGLSTIAEGIETDEQFAVIEGQGCDWFQGYLFSRPVTADKFGALLSEGRAYQRPARPAQDTQPPRGQGSG